MNFWTLLNFGIEELMEQLDPTRDEDSTLWQEWFEGQVGASWKKGTTFRGCTGHDLAKFQVGAEAGSLQLSWYSQPPADGQPRGSCPADRADFGGLFNALRTSFWKVNTYYEWLQSRDTSLPYEVAPRFWASMVEDKDGNAAS